MKNIAEIIYIGCGGFFGAVSRFLVSGYANKLCGKGFPYGTLTVNVAGSFLLGMISFLAISRDMMSDNVRVMITVGFLGAFTTFSTFSYETFNLIKEGSYYLSLMNIVTNILICLAAVALGVLAATLIERVF